MSLMASWKLQAQLSGYILLQTSKEVLLVTVRGRFWNVLAVLTDILVCCGNSSLLALAGSSGSSWQSANAFVLISIVPGFGLLTRRERGEGGKEVKGKATVMGR